MKLSELVEEFSEARAIGLMLTPDEVLNCMLRAVRYYAAYGRIASLAGTDNQPAAGEQPQDPPAEVAQAYPVKAFDTITEETELSVSEWAVISPLFNLYIEHLNALRLEASRASGIEPFGRSTSEIQQDITLMENETLPQRAFSHVVLTV